MAKQKESAFAAKVLKWLTSEGWKAWKNHGGMFSDNGIPDCMAVKDGLFIAVELKVPGNKPTMLQEKWLRDLRSHGVAMAGWFDSFDELKEAVRKIHAIDRAKHPRMVLLSATEPD